MRTPLDCTTLGRRSGEGQRRGNNKTRQAPKLEHTRWLLDARMGGHGGEGWGDRRSGRNAILIQCATFSRTNDNVLR